MYTNANAEFRPELLAVVQEAQGIDKKFIADKISPVYPVKTRTGDYMRITKGSGGLLATEGSTKMERAPGTAYRQVGRSTEKDGYKVVDRGLKEHLDDTITQDLSRFFDVESSTSLWLARNVRIAREQRVAAITFDEMIWGTTAAAVPYLDGQGNFINKATIDFPEDMKAGRRKVEMRGENPNSGVMSREFWDFISTSDKLKLYLFGQLNGAAAITPQMVAEKFELDQLLIGSASFVTSKKGKAVTDADLAWCWPRTGFWIGEVKGGPPEAGGALRTFVLEDTTNGGQLQVVETYRNEDLRSDILRVREDCDEKAINECSGTIIDVTTP